MALSPLANVSDLEARAGQQIEQADVPQAEAVLAMASAVVRAYVGFDPAGEGIIPDAAQVVTIDIAYRVWTNPDGLVGDTIDDASRRWSERSGDGFYLTAANKMILDGLRKNRRGLWTLQTTRGGAENDTLYVPTGPPPAGYPLPWYAADDPLIT